MHRDERHPADVELARRLHEEWDRNGPPRELLHEDVEWINPPEAVEPGTRRGRDAFAAAGGSVSDAFPTGRVEIERVISAGDGVVVVLGTFHVRGHGSGLATDVKQGYVWTIRDGKAMTFRWFNGHERALEAAGIEP